MTRAGAVAVMVGIAVTLAGCGGSPASHRHDAGPATTSTTGTRTSAADTAAGALHPDLGPFAGYTWNGDVNSAHADWTVPRLLPSSVRGEAANWIGAEAPGPRRGAPFVQVGVNEGDTDGAGAAFYYAFYSTTKLHFHPVHLFDTAKSPPTGFFDNLRGPDMKEPETLSELVEDFNMNASNHHPDIDIRWNKVTLTLSTHSEGGLTAKDFSMARQCSAIFARHSGRAGR